MLLATVYFPVMPVFLIGGLSNDLRVKDRKLCTLLRSVIEVLESISHTCDFFLGNISKTDQTSVHWYGLSGILLFYRLVYLNSVHHCFSQRNRGTAECGCCDSRKETPIHEHRSAACYCFCPRHRVTAPTGSLALYIKLALT